MVPYLNLVSKNANTFEVGQSRAQYDISAIIALKVSARISLIMKPEGLKNN
jgi:hypothetical protein